MVGGVAPLGRVNLTQASPARAVTPAPIAPTTEDRPPPPVAPALPAPALTPAAMSALIEAQAQMSSHASLFARQDTARKIDRLIDILDGDPPPPPTEATPFTVLRLQVARRGLA